MAGWARSQSMDVDKETLQRVQSALVHLRRELTPFVEARMGRRYGANWPTYAAALVNLAEDGEQQIHFLVLAQESEALVDDLARHCRERLPRYAQPTRISLLARFPLLPTGKFDRRALKNCIVHKTT